MKFAEFLFGRPLATEEEAHQTVGVARGVPMLGLDGLASAAYGAESALAMLLPLGVAGLSYALPIIGLIVAALVILYFSYRQTQAAYPHGGGSYAVAKENLGTNAGLLGAASLLLDYVLVVAVGISAGMGALVSAIPALHAHILWLCLAVLVVVTIVNLRGVRESAVAFAIPTYGFVALMIGTIAWGMANPSPRAGIQRLLSLFLRWPRRNQRQHMALASGLRKRLHRHDRSGSGQQRDDDLQAAARSERSADLDRDRRTISGPSA